MSTEFKPGDFVSETLVTDTVVFEVIKTTPMTITVRRTSPGDIVHVEDNGSPYPIVWTEAVQWVDGPVQTLRRYGDGGFRVSPYSSPLYKARLFDGVPATRTDYSF